MQDYPNNCIAFSSQNLSGPKPRMICIDSSILIVSHLQTKSSQTELSTICFSNVLVKSCLRPFSPTHKFMDKLPLTPLESTDKT